MNAAAKAMLDLVNANPHLMLAYGNQPGSTTEITALVKPNEQIRHLTVPMGLANGTIRQELHTEIKILVATPSTWDPTNAHQRCQDEPIRLGTQIQPDRANWVGTGGAPVACNKTSLCSGIAVLTNWHVAAMGHETPGRLIHQPTDKYPAIGYLAEIAPVREGQTHFVDAALVDAQVDGLHTIAREILELGPLNPPTDPLEIGNRVFKSGRTTGRTTGMVLATGAAARVNYGDFEAVFADQDVIEDTNENFSGPGDSGSLIVARCDCPGDFETFEPGALLFAGGGNLTIGNPERYVREALDLSWSF